MRVGIAYQAFFPSFKNYYPKLELIEDVSQVKKLDLVIFSGGEDIDPSIYGQKNRHSSFNSRRDNIELKILALSLDYGKKILGVCRGHQLINAYLGGDLIQDLYFDLEVAHKSPHPVRITSDLSLTNYILNNREVNSLHHQGVIRTGPRIKATSTYEKVIESTESENIFSVQWHPELMGDFKFFEVVNKWVLDREKLISEIIENFKNKSNKKTSAESADYVRAKYRDWSWTATTETNFTERDNDNT